MRNYTDEEVISLVKKSKRGNMEAFEELVEIYQKFVFGIILFDIKNREDAEDIAQEVFIKAWKGMSEFRQDSTFATWLYRISKNAVKDFVRNRERRPLRTDETEFDDKFIETNTPEQTVLNREKNSIILEIIDTLPTEQKESLIYRDLMGITYLEIADITGVTVGTVKSRISRARERVKKKISETITVFLPSKSAKVIKETEIMKNEKPIFSEEIENAYKKETESAIRVPENFKKIVIEKTKTEKLKIRKKTLIGLSSAAAVVILTFGAVIAATKTGIFSVTKDNESAYGVSDEANGSLYYDREFFSSDNSVFDDVDEDSAESLYDFFSDFESVCDDITDEKITSSHSDEELLYLQNTVYEADGKTYNWYSFYNAVIKEKINPEETRAKEYLKDNIEHFESVGMSAERIQAETLIKAVFPCETLFDAEEADVDINNYSSASSSVKKYLETNEFYSETNEKSLNFFEFYNDCIKGETDPRFGKANTYIKNALAFFENNDFSEGVNMAKFLLSAEY